MNAPWSPQQREWLQALGHDVLLPASAAGLPEPTAAQDVPVALDAPLRVAAASRSPAGIAASPLLRALLRAAGRREIGELAAWLPDPASLRGDAAAKRALWPRLRTLRKPPRGP